MTGDGGALTPYATYSLSGTRVVSVTAGAEASDLINEPGVALETASDGDVFIHMSRSRLGNGRRGSHMLHHWIFRNTGDGIIDRRSWCHIEIGRCGHWSW